MPVVIHCRNRKPSTAGRRRVSARWARLGAGTPWCRHCRRTRPPRPASNAMRTTRSIRRTVAACLPVGRRSEHRYAPTMVEQHGEQLSTREQILVEAILCFAETGYDGTSLNDIAAGCRHPPAEPAAPLPVQGAAVRRGLRTDARRLDHAARRCHRRRSARLRQGRAGPAGGLRLLRRQPVVRPAGSPRSASTAARTSASTWPRRCARSGIAASASSNARWTPARFVRTIPSSCCSRATARCSATSPTRRCSAGLLDVDPLGRDALERRREHIAAFYKVALMP